jgi:hypothetical protein
MTRAAPPVGVRAIPWAFLNHEVMKMWVWRTEHFEVRVSAAYNSYNWVVTDFMRSTEGRFLAEGTTRDFHETEDAVREIIGKSYPPKYGYMEYAGSLAYTFTIATGERIDFSQFLGHRTIVTVRTPQGQEKSFAGSVRPVHYEVHVSPGAGSAVKIQPSHIIKVTAESGRPTRTAAQATYTGVGRIYSGPIVRGCNGRPGFLPDTTDHTGDACPVHEDHVTY